MSNTEDSVLVKTKARFAREDEQAQVPQRERAKFYLDPVKGLTDSAGAPLSAEQLRLLVKIAENLESLQEIERQIKTHRKIRGQLESSSGAAP